MAIQSHLGIDAGTTNVKVALVDDRGSLIGSASNGFPVHQPRQGWHEIHPDSWWEALILTTREVLARTSTDPNDVVSIGVSGIGCTPCAIDQQGAILGNAPTWADSRAEVETSHYSAFADEVLRGSGSPLGSWSLLPKLWWWKANNPRLYDQIWKVMQPSSYLVYRLSNVISQDVHCASLSYNFDLETESWNTELTRKLDLDPDFFPPISLPLAPAGNGLTSAAAEALGLRAGTTVVNCGGDPVGVSLSMGVYKPGQTFLHTGTGSTIGVLNDQRLTHPSFLTQVHILPRVSYLSGLMSATGASMQWARDNLLREAVTSSQLLGGDLSEYQIMSALAEQSSAGSNGLVYLPYISGRQSPTWDADVRGVLIGLSTTVSRGDLVRAVMEGVAHEVASNLPVLAELGVAVDEIRAGGGPTKSRLWCQTYADVCGVPIVTSVSEGDAAIGDAWMAGIAHGAYSIEDCASDFAMVSEVYEPRQEHHERHREIGSALADLYPALRDYYGKIAAMGFVE